MLIKFITATFVADRSYAADEIADVPDEIARRVIDANAAAPHKVEPAKPATPAAANTPTRKATPVIETAVLNTPVDLAIAAD